MANCTLQSAMKARPESSGTLLAAAATSGRQRNDDSYIGESYICAPAAVLAYLVRRRLEIVLIETAFVFVSFF